MYRLSQRRPRQPERVLPAQLDSPSIARMLLPTESVPEIQETHVFPRMPPPLALSLCASSETLLLLLLLTPVGFVCGMEAWKFASKVCR